ncbi:hypothetical protein [Microbacterium lacticum]
MTRSRSESRQNTLESFLSPNKVYAHLRKRDYSAHRAAFSAHIAASSSTPAPVVALGG